MLRKPLFCLVLIVASAAIDASARTWNSATGTFQIEAELVEKKGDGTVLLKRADGVTIATKPEKLSAADQEYIKQWKPPAIPKASDDFESADAPVKAETALKPEAKQALGKIKSADAKTALQAYEQREKELVEKYAAKQKEYREKLAGLLEEALKDSTAAGDLDDALAIRNAVKALRSGGQDPVPQQAAGKNAAEQGATVRLSTLQVIGISDVVHVTVPNQLWVKISLGGQEIVDGITMHPWENKPAMVAFRLNGKFESISGKVGIDDDVRFKAAMPVSFALMGDKKVLWQSNPLQRSGESEDFDVKIPKVRVLTLLVQTGGSNQNAHARWGDVQLTPAPTKGKPAP